MRSFVVFAALVGSASASPIAVTGEVRDARSRWTADGTRIVTEATLHTETGDVVVSQLGGTADGLTMRTFPGPELLATGMRVTIAARMDFDLSLAPHVAVEGVKVLAYPPSYVRTGPTMGGHYLYWESGCVFIVVDAAGTKYIVADTEFPVIDQAIATWNNATSSCSYMQLLDEGRRDIEVGRDRVNVIKFRDVSWCRPATVDDVARCHPVTAAGITTATYVDDPASDRDGAIVDSDIELNGVQFALAVNGQTLSSAPCISELQNTLTHELGHLQGLEHTCLAMGDPPRIDNTGAAVPSCGGATATQVGATMYNFQDCGEVTKETLEADDIAAICSVYPTANDPGTCNPVDPPGGCCVAATGPNQGPLGPIALFGLLLVFWRRRH